MSSAAPKSRLAARRAAKAAPAPSETAEEPLAERPLAVQFPPSLAPAQRTLVHELAGAAGLPHASHGAENERCVVVGDALASPLVLVHNGLMADSTLVRLLHQHCGISPPAENVRQTSLPLSVDAFCAATLPLLEVERDAEAEEAASAHLAGPGAAARRGVSLLALRCTAITPGCFGRTLLTLELARGGGEPLPAHKFGPHDVAAVRPSQSEAGSLPLCSGTIFRVSEASVTVALDEAPDESLDGILRLDRLANEVTFLRLRTALKDLAAAAAKCHPLPEVLFGMRAPREVPVLPPAFVPLNSGLDASQLAAIRFALAAPEVALIHGPPGTGKTTALVELIAQLCSCNLRVLACAASNVAVDNLLERVRLQVPKIRAVRLGHPARLSPAVLECCLDACVARADSSALASDIRAEMKVLAARLLKLGAYKDRAERKDTRRQLSQLSREERTRTAAAVKEVVAGAQLVAATLTGALSRTMDAAGPFDVVVIDEAAQALEAACWGALLKGRRAVLAGDHLQLPPTVLSDAAARAGLGRTLFERAHAAHPQLCRMLTVQYRMAGAISDWASGELYGSRLTAPGPVADRTLSNMALAQPSLASFPVLLLFDTAGCECEESDSGESKSNDGEARVAMAHAQQLVAAGLPAGAIGLITPYAAQVTLLRQLRADAGPSLAALEVSTVDGFQGREKEAVVITCVRSNPRHEVGFLADARRMNVAVTRARRHVCIIANTETLGRDPFLRRMSAWFEAHGEVRSAAELL